MTPTNPKKKLAVAWNQKNQILDAAHSLSARIRKSRGQRLDFLVNFSFQGQVKSIRLQSVGGIKRNVRLFDEIFG